MPSTWENRLLGTEPERSYNDPTLVGRPHDDRAVRIASEPRRAVARELPTGRVCLVFTDIEGSTRMIQRLGAAYVEVLQVHSHLVREAARTHHGWEVDTQGDAFFLVFPSAEDAVEASVTIQRTLAAFRWPEGGGVRVRIGMHVGTPLGTADGYVGLAVHEAARICAVGHGGQIICSDAVVEALGSEPRRAWSAQSLGRFKLRDLEGTVGLHQVVAAGLVAGFPPLTATRE